MAILAGYAADQMAALRWMYAEVHRDTKKQPKPHPKPESVLPHARRSAKADAEDIPVVSPHRLGAFITPEDMEVP